MSAKTLNIDTLTPDLHRQIHDVVRENKGLRWANVLIGELPEYISFDDAYEEVIFDIEVSNIKLEETKDSLEDSTCIQCYRNIEEYEKIHCLYEYQDNEPAFYLCPQCESDSLLEFDEEGSVSKGMEDQNKGKGSEGENQ